MSCSSSNSTAKRELAEYILRRASVAAEAADVAEAVQQIHCAEMFLYEMSMVANLVEAQVETGQSRMPDTGY